MGNLHPSLERFWYLSFSKVSPNPHPRIHMYTYLKTGGNGGIFIICSLGVSYQVVPAGEHLPAKDKVILLCSVSSYIGITSHPEMKRKNRWNTANLWISTHVWWITSDCVSSLRFNDNHQAVSKNANTHKQVWQGESELQHPNRPLIVVVAIEHKGILAESLLMKYTKRHPDM